MSSEGCEQLRTRGLPAPPADMANRSNVSAPYYSYEYYLDYLDLLPVDEKELKAHKCESGPGGRQAEAGLPTRLPPITRQLSRVCGTWPCSREKLNGGVCVCVICYCRQYVCNSPAEMLSEQDMLLRSISS